MISCVRPTRTTRVNLLPRQVLLEQHGHPYVPIPRSTPRYTSPSPTDFATPLLHTKPRAQRTTSITRPIYTVLYHTMSTTLALSNSTGCCQPSSTESRSISLLAFSFPQTQCHSTTDTTCTTNYLSIQCTNISGVCSFHGTGWR